MSDLVGVTVSCASCKHQWSETVRSGVDEFVSDLNCMECPKCGSSNLLMHSIQGPEESNP